MFFNRIKKITHNFRRKKKVLKDTLEIIQKDDGVLIKGKVDNRYRVTNLIFQNREADFNYDLKVTEGSDFWVKINTKELLSYLNIDGIYDLYLNVKVDIQDLDDNEREKIKTKSEIIVSDDDKAIQYYQSLIRLGRFLNTNIFDIKPKWEKSDYYNFYKTAKGNISVAINENVSQKKSIQIDNLKSKKNKFTFNGKLFTRNSEINSINLIVKGRETSEESTFPVIISHLKDDVRKKYGLNRYKYKVILDLNEVFKNPLFKDDVYDLFFEIAFHDCKELVQLRIGNPRFRARFRTKGSSAARGDKIFSISPYYTVKRFNLSLQVDSFEHKTYSYLKRMTRWSWLFRMFYKQQDIWIIGERPYKAQDTGYHFFKYMRKMHPDKKVYYVIEEDSPELKNVKHLGKNVYVKSKEHIKSVLMASRIIGSHHPDYLYPLRTTDFIQKVKGKKVFLQHGILGTKNTEHFYGKNSLSFSTDLFLVSSEREKSIVVNDFGYSKKEVAITGLSRFDRLFDNAETVKRQLLIIPTWREWLVEESKFLESEYFERYRDLVLNETLHEYARRYNFEILFCLHPNMQKYTPFFQDAPVKIISQGEIDVQDLLKESSMMITDYSSVAFDFSFLNKPIIYYQFDLKRFIGNRGSHLNLDKDLTGDIVFELNDILTKVKKYSSSDFQMTENNKIKASKFLEYRDTNNCLRIYNAVSKRITNKSLVQSIGETEFYRTAFKRFRKSEIYFPTMKKFYKVARKIFPVDEKLILFESGIGKQYADSPKNIYEELVNRDSGYKVVWVCNKNIRFRNLETKRVKRLSPSYYYYLAKAKVWVNNQNFPTYIKKRPETIYIQTWHGTPLKKMLHDIENVQGRSDDYVERVSGAISNWDYLVSPSRYATNAFRSAFRFNGNIIETGYPRNDIFYKNKKDELAIEIKNNLCFPLDKKIILYAPTFRDNKTNKKNKFQFEMNLDLSQMKERLGDDYILLIRTHVVVGNKLNIDSSLGEFVMDVSNYSDIQDLLLITDILVTDYSSVMFDFANTKRPMLFYTYDFETYRDEVRGFYMDFENEAPGPLLRTTEELVDGINNIRAIQNNYENKYEAFYQKYCGLEDGFATKRVVDMLLENKYEY